MHNNTPAQKDDVPVDIGYVVGINEFLVKVSGLPGAWLKELVVFDGGAIGQVFSINEETVDVLVIEKAQILIDEGMSLNQVHKLTGFSQKQIRKKTQAPLFKKYSEIKASILEFNPEFPWEGFIYFLNKKEQEKRQEEK